MNFLPDELLKKANIEAMFNLYLYLVHKNTPIENETLQSILYRMKNSSVLSRWTANELYRLKILDAAVSSNHFLAASRLHSLTFSKAPWRRYSRKRRQSFRT